MSVYPYLPPEMFKTFEIKQNFIFAFDFLPLLRLVFKDLELERILTLKKAQIFANDFQSILLEVNNESSRLNNIVIFV